MDPITLVILLVILAALTLPLIPLRRRRKGLDGFPLVTLLLLFLNVIFFVGNQHGGELPDEVALHWGLIPRHAAVITLLTHMFLHGSWGHIFGNMLGLWLFGPHVEEALGRLEYLLFYLGSGIAAGLLHLLIALTLEPAAANMPLVGASGAIFGVMGLFAFRFWRTRVRVFLFFQVPAVWAVGAFALYQVVEGLRSLAVAGQGENIANWAHIGGFVFGLLIAIPLRMREDSTREYGLEDAEKAAAAGQLDDAATHYRALLERSPGDAASHHALARVCVQLRQGEAAHRHFMDALRLSVRQNLLPLTARVYEDALQAFEVFPLDAGMLARVASACEVAEQFPLALRALSELCRDHPREREAEMGMLRLGKMHLQKLNQPQNAAAIFSEFLRLYPGSEWAAHALRLRDEAYQAAGNGGGSPLSAPGA